MRQDAKELPSTVHVGLSLRQDTGRDLKSHGLTEKGKALDNCPL